MDDVLVVDRSPVFAEGLARLLQQLGHGATHASAEKAEAAAAARPPSVLLLDADGDVRELVALAGVLRDVARSARLILLVGEGERPPAELARLTGARGCVSRHASGEVLDVAIRRSRSGEALPPLIGAGRRRRRQPSVEQLLGGLTERELLVLRSMMGGQRSRDIAALLGISPHTVRTHVQNILSKLAVHTRVEAGMLALRAGLSPLSTAAVGSAGS